MIFVTERDALASAMARVAGIIDPRNTIPILSNVHLTAKDDGLTIRSTNQEIEVSEIIPAEIGEPGETTVAASTLREIANSLPSGAQIGFKLGARLAVSSGKAKFNLGVLPPDSFPEPWVESWATEFEIDGGELSALLGRVSFAQEKDAARTYLMGVRIEAPDGRLRLIATNGAYLPYCDGPTVPTFSGITIPSRLASEIARMASSASGDVKIGISDGKLSISDGDAIVTGKLLDKSLGYPDYHRVIPKPSENIGEVRIDALIAAIRRAMISATEGKRRTVRLSFGENSLSAMAHNMTSDALDEIETVYAGADIDLPFNPDLMIEMLQSLPSDFATFEVGKKTDATIWRAKGDEDGLVVAMPQRVGA